MPDILPAHCCLLLYNTQLLSLLAFIVLSHCLYGVAGR